MHWLREPGVWNVPCDTEALAMVMRAVGRILGRRIVSLTLDSSTGSSFSGGLCLCDPSSPHVFQSWYVDEPGVVTDSDVVVCNSSDLHFDACPPALPESVQSPQRSPADHYPTAEAEDGALRGDPLDQALGAGAAATIRAARVAGTHAPSARAGVYAHAFVSARPCPPVPAQTSRQPTAWSCAGAMPAARKRPSPAGCARPSRPAKAARAERADSPSEDSAHSPSEEVGGGSGGPAGETLPPDIAPTPCSPGGDADENVEGARGPDGTHMPPVRGSV